MCGRGVLPEHAAIFVDVHRETSAGSTRSRACLRRKLKRGTRRRVDKDHSGCDALSVFGKNGLDLRGSLDGFELPLLEGNERVRPEELAQGHRPRAIPDEDSGRVRHNIAAGEERACARRGDTRQIVAWHQKPTIVCARCKRDHPRACNDRVCLRATGCQLDEQDRFIEHPECRSVQMTRAQLPREIVDVACEGGQSSRKKP